MKNPEGEQEQRTKERIPFNWEVVINGTIPAKAIDISKGGLYIHTAHPFKVGDIIDISLPFKDETLTVKAKIKHKQTGVGFGLMFVDLDDVKIHQINELIKETIKKPSKLRANKSTVLFVEDNDVSRQMIKHRLISEGFWVIEARDGIEAIKILNEQPVDIIILDLYMEKMNGFKVLSIIKESEQWKNIPVVVYSAKGTSDVMDKVFDAGADDFLLKMVTSPAKLADVLRTLIKRREE